MGMNNFCGFKTAYLITREEFNYIEGLLVEDNLFWEEMNKIRLPEGWTFTGRDISGAAGFVITFDITGLPTENQMEVLVIRLRELDNKYKRIAWEKKNIFNVEEFDNWSVYELTSEMVSEAQSLWDDDMRGDYGRISEMLELDHYPAGEVPVWKNPMKRGNK